MMKKQIGAQDEAECTLACLKQGGKLVLYDKKNLSVPKSAKGDGLCWTKVKVADSQIQDNVVQIETIQSISQ
jgi:hypothetical protein